MVQVCEVLTVHVHCMKKSNNGFRKLQIPFQEFEKLEEVRISWLRNELWVHTNIMSQLCVDNDEVTARDVTAVTESNLLMFEIVAAL